MRRALAGPMRLLGHVRSGWVMAAAVCLLAWCVAGVGQEVQGASSVADGAYRVPAERFLRGRTVAGAQAGGAAGAMASARREHGAMARAGTAQAGAAGVGVSRPAASLSAAWQSVGPGQVAAPAYGLVTGRVTAIAIDPGDATGNTVYLGTTGGGVWKSTNAAGAAAAVSFVPLTDTLPVFSANAGTAAIPSLSIGAVAVQPGGGPGAVVLAGTGDPNDATDSYYGEGILRSADGGSTWTLAQESHDGVAGNHSFVGLGTAGFAWSTATTGLVVAAMSQSAEGTLVNAVDETNSVMGLYFSTNAGVTWQMATVMDGGQVVQTPLPSGGNAGGNAATSVVWNPLRQMFFAAVRFHGVYGSADGMTWTRLAHQPGVGLTTAACPANPGLAGSPGCPLFRSALAVQGLSGDTYAVTVDTEDRDQGIWEDVCGPSGGACGNAVGFGVQVPSGVLERGGGSTVVAQGDYDLALAASPAAAGDGANTELYVGTVDVFRCGFANGAAAGCLLRNTTNALNGCGAPAMVAPAQHALAALALGAPLVFVGNDGGLWRSTDGVAETGPACSASDAGHFDNLNGSLGSLAEVVSLAAHPTDADTLVAGLGANGIALTGAASSGAAWAQVAAGEGGAVGIDQADPANVYVSTGPGVSIAHCAKGSACAAADFGGAPTIGEAQVGEDASLVDAPFLLDPALMSDVLIGTCRVWRGPAMDGSLWSSENALSEPFGGGANTPCVAGSNPLVRSLAAGGAASGASAAQNAGSTVLYAGLAGALDGGGTLGGHVFTTSSGGTAGPSTVWADTARTNVVNDVASGGRFNPGGFDVSSVVADAHDATGKTVYATVMGFAGNGVNAPHVYRSVDGGGHWTNVSSNLPNAPANSVAVDPNDANTVYVALDTGVYVTSQVATCAMANCWSVLGTGLPQAPVMEVVATAGVPTGDGRSGLLRAATYGRGVWETPLLTAVSSIVAGIGLSPATLTFAAQAVGSESGAETVTVTNSGNASLTVSSVTASGDFVEADTCTAAGANVFAPGGTCTVQVSFLPSAAGVRTGVLTVFGNAPGGQATVALSGTGTTAAAIVLNPVGVVFPSTSVGAVSAPINVTISNTGGTAAGLQVPVVTGAGFRIAANTCASTLAAQTGCTVAVVFAPGAAGSAMGSLSITDDAGTQTASLMGVGTAPATDGLTPLSLSFGPQVLNTTSPVQGVTLTNAGDVALTLIGAAITSGDFTVVNGCGNSLNGHSSCTIGVAYVPKNVGAETGVMTVSDEFRGQTVALAGTGLAPAGVSLAPFAGLSFGAVGVGVKTVSQTVTLTNNGGVGLGVSGVAISGDFAVVPGSDTCGATLAAGAACTLEVVFLPAAGGTRTGALVFTDTAANSPQTLALTGVGVDFTLTANGATTVTVASGTPAVFPLLLTSASGTPGSASLTCLGAPANATCNVTPQDPALGGTTTISVTVLTGVTAPGGALRAGASWAALGMLGCVPVAFSRGRRRLRVVLAGVILVGVIGGCGVGRAIPGAAGLGASSQGVPTPSGSYSLPVSATSAGLTRTVNVTLVVQ